MTQTTTTPPGTPEPPALEDLLDDIHDRADTIEVGLENAVETDPTTVVNLLDAVRRALMPNVPRGFEPPEWDALERYLTDDSLVVCESELVELTGRAQTLTKCIDNIIDLTLDRDDEDDGAEA